MSASQKRGSRLYRHGLKRCLDVLAALLGLVLLWPLMAVTGLFVLRDLGRPVLFRQLRPGLHGRLFVLRKFRTMRELRSAGGELLPDGRRLTKLGRVLRRSSLDELPELFNVLRGEMSLVGPRPLLPRYLERYSREQARRHEVRPGMTGLAQVSGRNALAWEDRLRLDTWYVDHLSFRLDARILALTLLQVLRGQGVSQPGQDTAQEFMGAGGAVAAEEAP